MTWTAPRTWVEGETLTAELMNAQIRDNLNSCAPPLAAGSEGYFVTTGLNQVSKRQTHRVVLTDTAQTTSTTYTDDTASPGPSLTVSTGTSALCIFGATMFLESGGPASVKASVAVSGATTSAASDNWALRKRSSSQQRMAGAQFVWFKTLTPGQNTFTMKYAVGASTGKFHRRRMMIMPFN